MLRLKEFVAEGIGPETLARLVREEAVIRPVRGSINSPTPMSSLPIRLAAQDRLSPIRFVRFTGSALTEGVERHRIERNCSSNAAV